MTPAAVVEQFLRHRRVTEQLCALMPDDQYGFRPYEGAMSFGQLAVHLVLGAEWFLGFAEGNPFRWPKDEELPNEPAAIREYLAQATARTVERMARLGEEPEKVVLLRDKETPMWGLLASLREHEAHHKGQMLTYLRMCGVGEKLFYTQ